MVNISMLQIIWNMMENEAGAPCVLGTKWKQKKKSFSRQHWECLFLVVRNHALLIFASSFLSTAVPTWEMTNTCHMDLLNFSSCIKGAELQSNDWLLVHNRGTSEFTISLVPGSGYILGSPENSKNHLAPNPEYMKGKTSVALKLPILF